MSSLDFWLFIVLFISAAATLFGFSFLMASSVYIEDLCEKSRRECSDLDREIDALELKS